MVLFHAWGIDIFPLFFRRRLMFETLPYYYSKFKNSFKFVWLTQYQWLQNCGPWSLEVPVEVLSEVMVHSSNAPLQMTNH